MQIGGINVPTQTINLFFQVAVKSTAKPGIEIDSESMFSIAQLNLIDISKISPAFAGANEPMALCCQLLESA